VRRVRRREPFGGLGIERFFGIQICFRHFAIDAEPLR
jgi:hypothetical protein